MLGAPQDDDVGDWSGSAYVFRRDDQGTPEDPTDDVWVQMDGEDGPKLTASDAAAWDYFGRSVSISGDYAVVSAPVNDDAAGTDQGSAYVFRRDDNGTPADPNDDVWEEVDKLIPGDAAAYDYFGQSVSLSGDYALVGAQYADTPGAENSGAAYIFRRDPTDGSWDEVAKLTASDATGGDYFGCSVSLSGDCAAVGALAGDDWAGVDQGSAYVFRRDDSGTPADPNDDIWVQQDKLIAGDAAENDQFGWSVSLSGNRVVVGAHKDDDAAGVDQGSAHVFRCDDNGTPADPNDHIWVEQDKLIAGDAAENDQFGWSVSLSGDYALVGAWWHDGACPGDPNCDSGAAYLFRRDDNGTPTDPTDDFWIEEAKPTAADAAAGDNFGNGVSLNEGYAVVGARTDDDEAGVDQGSAYVFRVLGAADCNFNGVNDACELYGDDCDSNGVPDECDLTGCYASPSCGDCNGNDILDWCDIDAGTSQDINASGIPDECECQPSGQMRGDCNGDGSINGLDIDPFVEALVNPDQYNTDYDPLRWECTADINCDGSMNGLDIEPFVQCLTSGCSPCL